MKYDATISITVKVPFDAPGDGPHQISEELLARVPSAPEERAEFLTRYEEEAAAVAESRIAAASHAEEKLAKTLTDALAKHGEILDVTVKEVEGQ